VKAAVIIVDMINDFVTGALKCEHAQRIIPNIRRLLGFARKERIPIIVPEDCMETITEEAQKTAIEYMKTIYGCKITNVDKLMNGELV